MHTIQECSQLWVLFEERVDYIPPFLEMRRHTNSLLKTCNELLRRLSKSNDPVSCGRILMFLAYVFPLSDKSGNESLYHCNGLTLFFRIEHEERIKHRQRHHL